MVKSTFVELSIGRALRLRASARILDHTLARKGSIGCELGRYEAVRVIHDISSWTTFGCLDVERNVGECFDPKGLD